MKSVSEVELLAIAVTVDISSIPFDDVGMKTIVGDTVRSAVCIDSAGSNDVE
jgi:hypothetical protein